MDDIKPSSAVIDYDEDHNEKWEDGTYGTDERFVAVVPDSVVFGIS
jgi:hypothetical protein